MRGACRGSCTGGAAPRETPAFYMIMSACVRRPTCPPRARAAVPPEVRRDQLAGEWATARAEAARAKGAGDTARQKLVGLLIGALKQEATGLGLTDADLEAALGGAGGKS